MRRSRSSLLFDAGSLSITRLSIDNPEGPEIWSRAEPTTPGDPDDTTDRRVPLLETLQPDQTLVLYVEFETKLPFLVERMGWVEDFFSVAQWFPKLARLEDDGTWRHFPYEPLAEFSADFGDYDITVNTPERMIIAAPGQRSEISRAKGRVVTRFQMNGVHDFAFFASPRFIESETKSNGVRIHIYAPPGHQRNVETEISCLGFGLDRFQKMFGDYPYPELIVVHPPDVAAAAGGMEYPGLIVTGGPWYSSWSGLRNLEAVVLHELAHQWFYGIIATDEARYPVLDEGLATWAEFDALRALFGPGSAFSGFGITVSVDATAMAANTLYGDAGPLARPASGFHGFRELAATIYARTGLLFETLANVYGAEKLRQALHHYAEAQRFQHPNPDALVDAIETEMGNDAAQNLRIALDSNTWVDYRVEQLSTKEIDNSHWANTVQLAQRGSLRFPVTVSLKLKSGDVIQRELTSSDPNTTWNFTTSSPLESAFIDSEGRILIESRRDNNALFRKSPPQPVALFERTAYYVALALSGVLP